MYERDIGASVIMEQKVITYNHLFTYKIYLVILASV